MPRLSGTISESCDSNTGRLGGTQAEFDARGSIVIND